MGAVAVSFLVGGLAVLQAGLNRLVMEKWGLSTAILINSAVLLTAASLFWLLQSKTPRAEAFQFQWWYVVPGLCGFALVAGIPWVISQMGALRTFMCIVIAQMIAGLIWDFVAEGIAFDWRRLTGAVVVALGLMIASWRVDGP